MQTCPQAIIRTITACGLAFALGAPLTAQSPVAVERIAPDMVFSRIIASALGSDGRICVADDIEVKVTCLTSDGKPLWSYGRRGGGPGEWRQLYRLALAPDMTAFVADFMTGELHRLSANGAYLGKARFPSSFGQMSSLIAISRDTFLVAGTLGRPTAARDAAIHVFSFRDSVTYLRSFGELPMATDRHKLSMSGPGPVTLTAKGTLLYSRGFPYTVTEYTVAGTALRSVTNPLTTMGPDDKFTIKRYGTKVSIGSSPPRAGDNFVMAAREIGDGTWWVYRRVTGGKQFFDIVDTKSGKWATPVPFPTWSSSLGIFGEDRKRGVFIAATECDDEPCLVRFPSRPFIGR